MRAVLLIMGVLLLVMLMRRRQYQTPMQQTARPRTGSAMVGAAIAAAQGVTQLAGSVVGAGVQTAGNVVKTGASMGSTVVSGALGIGASAASSITHGFGLW